MDYGCNSTYLFVYVNTLIGSSGVVNNSAVVPWMVLTYTLSLVIERTLSVNSACGF
jgi:hypothetical protein